MSRLLTLGIHLLQLAWKIGQDCGHLVHGLLYFPVLLSATGLLPTPRDSNILNEGIYLKSY